MTHLQAEEGAYFLVPLVERGVVVLEAMVDLLGVLAPIVALFDKGVAVVEGVAFFPLVLKGLGRVIC